MLKTILNRILNGWNFQRVLFVIMGSFVIIQSVLDKQWWGVLLGGYFVTMGVCALGCAGGNCYNKSYEPNKTPEISDDFGEVEFIEIKNKQNGNK